MDIFATTLVCTTVCTLKCKNCLIKIPYQEKMHSDFENMKKAISRYFSVVNRVEEFTIMGGEAFLHPQFPELMGFMDEYSHRIGKVFLITQASYVPKQTCIDAVSASKCNCVVHIDDYGCLSKSLDAVEKMLINGKIEYDVRHYNEEEQYYGGWVDVVGDFECQNYPDQGLDVYHRCKNNTNCKFIWDGVLYSCGMHAAGYKLGKVPLNKGDAVSLLDDAISDQDLQEIIKKMGTKPMAGCNYCKGWDVHQSPRIKAAIQLTDVK